MTPIRLLIADDHHMVRAGLAALLSLHPDFSVVGEASNGLEAVNKARDMHPDLVIMDINMPQMNGIEAAHQLTHSKHPVKVLILSQFEEEEYIRRVVQAGASGYLLKNSLADELPEAVRTVIGGGRYFTRKVSETMVNSFVSVSSGQEHDVGKRLTPREREILQHIAEGDTNQQTADRLNISVRTVEFHRANLMEKIGMKDVAGLVKFALQNKIIHLKDP